MRHGNINQRQDRLTNVGRQQGPRFGNPRKGRVTFRVIICHLLTIRELRALPSYSQRFFDLP